MRSSAACSAARRARSGTPAAARDSRPPRHRGADDREAIAAACARLRAAIEHLPVPEPIRYDVVARLSRMGGGNVACAVRSSATAEDLPSSSFAGQQDTYLNVRGADAVIDARFGLGEAFVSGLVDADNYRVRAGRIIGRKIAVQTKELRARPDGGTEERQVEPARQHAQTLDDARIRRLEALGRTIEAHFGAPRTSSGRCATESSTSCRAGRVHRRAAGPRPQSRAPSLRRTR
ncbi:PEP/pyruvate-binding domain-containing protein [Nonomuraea endophytica]|uniref:Phosphoenolpyruvate synthase n=1 Tax=Nonomuraea endophytica TaxID=714136 RepID=A0A7W8AGE5_9ACTN|nr:PEP/pyruvate-binding domain-containing protein [Nonomuraea endophytica]MBB5084680.1 phosphoenolpyruvate synthase/pyruvate phosphate dikinase [Nonomuraea endophytica]